ncbi:LysR family transcriptional regulator [Vibrio sp. 10N.261.55.A7]|uniref:LysR family transcriptional regulator n=1 Tax=Vibrio sp. 10N.261.55.A7 TaxID=1880851 RepID=UPI000C82AFD6|nr:LysR family transcriptional regulator [Vibrio sp. 10N.261.55.A7]PMJ91739.1 LysR family transcriptional regulator [Vibrio sp. 10N.261.55.A7]
MDKLEMMKTFMSVVTEGSFSKAADKRGISPQLASKYVSALEDKLQTRLLHRTTRKINLTEAGHLYSARCEQVLSDINEMENSLGDWHQKVAGTLTINAPMSFGHRHLPKLLVDFQRRYPDVKIDLSLTDHKVNIVEEGVDVALRIGNLKSDTVIAKRITDIQVALLASPEYLERKGTPTSQTDLPNHDFLNYSYADQGLVMSVLGGSLAERNVCSSITANNGDLLVNTAILGAGITLQPTFIAGEAIKKGELVKILPEHQPKPVGLYLIYANRQFLPVKTRAFIDFVSGYFGDTPYWDDISSE